MASQQLKPQFFVTRQNGAMVPLIAMDELPIHVRIQGVSRSLNAFEVAGMTGIGPVDARHEFYVVENLNNTKSIPFVPSSTTSGIDSANSAPLLGKTDLAASAPRKSSIIDVTKSNDTSDASGPSSNTSVASIVGDVKSSRATTPDTTAPGDSDEQTPVKADLAPLAWRKITILPPVPALNSVVPPLPGLNAALTNKSLPEYNENPEMPVLGEKIYCSHWLRLGECSFTQTGCLYKHVMPMSIPVLEALGLRDLPEWFRKAHGFGSLRINGGRNGLNFGITVPNVSVPPRQSAPRARLDLEVSRRVIAGQINSMPIRGVRPTPNGQVHASNPRPAVTTSRSTMLASPRIPRILTDVERAAERERHDKRMAAAFDADLESNACTDMMDPEMERIREKEQAGWEEEQKARQTPKKAEASGSESGDKDERKTDVIAASAGQKKNRTGYGRRSPRRNVKKD